LKGAIGDLSALDTTDKSTLVNAINEVEATATMATRYRGALGYGADTLATMANIPTEQLAVGDLCGVHSEGKTYEWDGTAWQELAPVAPTLGDMYEMARWFGVFGGITYTGNGVGKIVATSLDPTVWSLLVVESTPVEQIADLATLTLADNEASENLPTTEAGSIKQKLQQTRDYIKGLSSGGSDTFDYSVRPFSTPLSDFNNEETMSFSGDESKEPMGSIIELYRILKHIFVKKNADITGSKYSIALASGGYLMKIYDDSAFLKHDFETPYIKEIGEINITDGVPRITSKSCKVLIGVANSPSSSVNVSGGYMGGIFPITQSSLGVNFFIQVNTFIKKNTSNKYALFLLANKVYGTVPPETDWYGCSILLEGYFIMQVYSNV
jgi:hypothetical protein